MPALAVLPKTGEGIGLVHATGNDALQYTRYSGSAWSALTSLNGDTTRATPAIAAAGGVAHVVFQTPSNYLHFYESYSAGTWSAAKQAIVPASAAQQICGPNGPALAPLGAGASLVYVNGGACGGPTNRLMSTDLSGGIWQTLKDVGADGNFTGTIGPAVAQLASGPELLAVWVQLNDSQLRWSTRSGGTWSPPAVVTGASTFYTPSLAPKPAGGAVLAFRGTDDNLYTVVFDSTTGWATPVAPFGTATAVTAAPSIAKGQGSALVELAYVNATGVWHSELIGTSWTTAVQVLSGAGYTGVAIATGP
jgi:hypothetical protein